MMNLDQVLTAFISLAIHNGGWMELDRLYLKNRIMLLIGENNQINEEIITDSHQASAETLVDALVSHVKSVKHTENDGVSPKLLKTQLWDLLMPPPSVVNVFFAQHYAKNPQNATDYFYQLNRQSGYLKKTDAVKSTEVETDYGKILLQKRMSSQEMEDAWRTIRYSAGNHYEESNVPQCFYCFESEGYSEQNAENAAKRFIRMNLSGESWGFQFSPYEQYSEQFYVSSEKHAPLETGKQKIDRMTRIVDIFPHYFISLKEDRTNHHGYYEGGRLQFPLSQKRIGQYIELPDFPLLNVGEVNWPFPVIRLQSPNKEDIVEGAALILAKWQRLNGVNIPDREVSMIGHRREGTYEFDLLFSVENYSVDEREAVRKELSIAELSGLHVYSEKEYAETEIAGNDKQQLEVLAAGHIERLKQTNPFDSGDVTITFEEFLLSLEQQ